MSAHIRLIAAVALAGAWTGGFVLAQTPPPAAPQGQTTTPPAQGQGAAGGAGQAQQPPQQGRGRVNAPPGGGGRVGGFTQYTRPIDQDQLVRGKSVYDANCASCHAVDLRGTADGKNPNLLRSGVTLRDQGGVLLVPRAAKHTPPITLAAADAAAISEYVHSVQATMGGQGSPPGRNPTGVTLNVLVGDATKGQATFSAVCGTCHSITGDLKGIGSKFSDARTLQNGWVSGSAGQFGAAGGGGGGRGGGGGGSLPATVTLANGTKLQGTLVREDDFLVILNLPDGTRKSMARTPTMKVEVNDRRAGHVNAIVKLAHEDTTSGMMHDITAYLWTIK